MKQVDHMLSILQAYKEGKVIQWRTKEYISNWEDMQDAVWNCSLYEYRIKPVEPRKFLACRYDDGWRIFPVENIPAVGEPLETIRVVEVLDGR